MGEEALAERSLRRLPMGEEALAERSLRRLPRDEEAVTKGRRHAPIRRPSTCAPTRHPTRRLAGSARVQVSWAGPCRGGRNFEARIRARTCLDNKEYSGGCRL